MPRLTSSNPSYRRHKASGQAVVTLGGQDVYLGPHGTAASKREYVRPFLKPDLTACLFAPADADRERREAQHEARKTPLSCGNRPGTNRSRKPRKTPGTSYTVESYCKAIHAACADAFPPPAELARQRIAARRGKNAKRWETPAEWKARLGAEKWAALQAWVGQHRWHPHRLRHSAATYLRKRYGLEAARVVLGHRSSAVAEVYAEIDQTKAEQIMGEVG
jgi:hypothetical protein